MKVRIEIDTKTFIRFWLVVFGFAFVILAVYLARTALIIIGAAAFLALALSVPVNRLTKYIPGKSRIGATAVAFVSIVVFIGLMMFLVVPPIVDQTIRFINAAPEMITSISQQWAGIGRLIEQYNLQSHIDSAIASMNADTNRWLNNLGRNTLSGIGSLFSVIGSTFLALVLAFLMLVEGPAWLRRLWGVYQDQDLMESHKALGEKMHQVVAGYVTGQLTVSGIGSLCSGAMVFILSLIFPDIPGNLALPTVAITFILSLIPMFGATIAGIIISLLLMFSSVTGGIIFAIFFIIYQQVENNFVSPAIQSKYVQLSPLAVMVAVTIGLYLFGLAGGIISIPIAGCVKVLIEAYLDHSKKMRKRNNKPAAKLAKKLSAS